MTHTYILAGRHREFIHWLADNPGQSAIYVSCAEKLLGCTLEPEQLVIMDGFWKRADAERIYAAAEAAIR